MSFKVSSQMLAILVVAGMFLMPTKGFSSDLTSEQIFDKLESLNAMREALASTISSDQTVTVETFNSVCKPVGMGLKKWAEDNKVTAKQISHKNRNEMNTVPSEVLSFYREFQKKADLKQKQASIKLEDIEGEVYLYRIPVVNACLKCHGEKQARPAFVKEKYKADKAFGFKEGDLRGIYMVFKPKAK